MPEFLTVEPGRGEGRGGKNREYPKKKNQSWGWVIMEFALCPVCLPKVRNE